MWRYGRVTRRFKAPVAQTNPHDFALMSFQSALYNSAKFSYRSLNLHFAPETAETYIYIYSEVSVIAVNGDRDHPRKLKIREVAAPL